MNGIQAFALRIYDAKAFPLPNHNYKMAEGGTPKYSQSTSILSVREEDRNNITRIKEIYQMYFLSQHSYGRR